MLDFLVRTSVHLWVTNWKKVVDLSTMTAGQAPQSSSPRNGRANLLKQPLTEGKDASPRGQKQSSGVLHQGILEMERGNNIEMRYVVLFEDRLENYKDRAHFKKGERAKSTIRLDNVQEFKEINNGFYIMYRDVSLRLHARQPEDFDAWKSVFGELFFLDEEKLSTEVIHQGPLSFVWKGKEQKHNFVLYSDRMEYYALSADFGKDSERIGRFKVAGIRGFKILDEGFVVRLENDVLELRVVDPKHMEPWLSAFREVLMGTGTTSSAKGQGGVPTISGDRSVSPAQRSSSPQASSGFQSPLLRRPGQENHPIHQGPLSIQHTGRLMKKYFVLYPERLDYFESPVDAVSGQKPLGRIALSEVMSHEMFGTGLILDLLGRKVGLKADHDSDVKQWDKVIKQAMSALRPPGFSPIPLNQRGGARARSSTPPRTASAKSRVFDFMTPSPSNASRGNTSAASCPHCGGDRSLSPSPASRSAASRGRTLTVDTDAISPVDLIGRSRSAEPTNLKRPDTANWVQIPTFNRWQHTGGRPWSSTEPSDKIQKRETDLKSSWKSKRRTLEPKITSDWDQKSRDLKKLEESRKDFAEKVNVPDREKRLTVRDLEEERDRRTKMPKKITYKTTYGRFPNYKVSRDKVYLKCGQLESMGPDFVFEQISQDPSFTKITSTPVTSPRTPRTPKP